MTGSRRVLVLTDVAGSTRLWSEHPAVMLTVMRRHHRMVHEAVHAHGGWIPMDQGEGDAVFASFTSAASAVAAVLDFQRALEEEPWPEGIVLRDRVGIDAGVVEEQDGKLFGLAVSRAARIRSLGAGGQVLASQRVMALVDGRLPAEVHVVDLGTHRLRDIDEPEPIRQLVGPGMVASFPPLTASVPREIVLPAARSSFLGREREVAELVERLRTDRLVTVTGFGGMGKTRVAVAVAAAAAEADEQLDVRFVDLSGVDRPASIGPAFAAALGIDEGIEDPLARALRWLRGRHVLLVLDNLEQLMPAAPEVVARVLDAAPDLRVLATSREPLRLLGERVFALGPLDLPPEAAGDRARWTDEDVEALGRFSAVRLLVARASAARQGFALTPDTAQAVAAICLRLEGSPLATELVAVRLRAQSPQALLPRLEHALPALGGGIRDLPARQQTLRATIDWSARALEPTERRLLWRLSVFPGSFTAEAAELVCGAGDGTDVLGGLLELVDRSLVRLHAADGIDGVDRFSLLVPIRELATERLCETEPDGDTQDRHADHFAEAVRFGPDRTRADRDALCTIVEAEWHNIRAALDRLHDRGRVQEELALSPMLGRCLQLLGREGTAVSLLRHAADHLDPDDGEDAAILVLTHLADIEFGTGRAASALPTLLRAHRLLDSAGPTATVLVAVVNTLMQDPCGADPPLFDRAHDLVTAMPHDRGDRLPTWYLTEFWVTAAIIAGDRRADALQVTMLASAVGRELLRLRSMLGADLAWAGRTVEAEELLAPFADARVRERSYPVDRILPLMVLADIRVAAGRVGEAADVLDAATADLAAFDQPFEHVMSRVQRSAIDRAMGDLDRAGQRLESLLASADADGAAAATGYAHWLLAVVERERRRPVAAAAELRLAWDVARIAQDEELVVGCLLERSAQRADGEPDRALRDLAMAMTHPAHIWVHFAVDHDADRLRQRLEQSLGPEAVAVAFATAEQRDLQLPEWDAAD